MANLIEYIQSQVYENSTEDISGSIMQQVLTRMASDEGVVNVHTITGQTPFADYNNAQAARDAVPAGFKKLGLIITYKLSSGWYVDEFIGSATSGWSTASNWKCLGPISVSQNASTGKTTITIGSQSYDVATQPVSVSQNSQTGHTDVTIGDTTTPVASVKEVSQLDKEINGLPSVVIDLSEYELITGTIYAVDNKFYNAGAFAIHRIKMIPCGDYAGRNVTIIPGPASLSYNTFSITFLKENVVAGSEVVYATGFAYPLSYTGEQTLEIPVDAQYLYIYIKDIRQESDTTPSSVVIDEIAGDFYKSTEVDDKVREVDDKVGENNITDATSYKSGRIYYIKEFSPAYQMNDDGTLIVQEVSVSGSIHIMSAILRDGNEIYLAHSKIGDKHYLELQANDKIISTYIPVSEGGAIGYTFKYIISSGMSADIYNLEKDVSNTNEDIDVLRNDIGVNDIESVTAYESGVVTFIKEYSPAINISTNTEIIVKKISSNATEVLVTLTRGGVVKYIPFEKVDVDTFSYNPQIGDQISSIYIGGGAIDDTFTINFKTAIEKDVFDLNNVAGINVKESVLAYASGSIIMLKAFSPAFSVKTPTSIIAVRKTGSAKEVLCELNRGGAYTYPSFTRINETTFVFDAQEGDTISNIFIGYGAANDGFELYYKTYTAKDVFTLQTEVNALNARQYRKGVNWIAIGDSLTDVQTLGPGVDNYVNLVARALQLNPINKGESGTGYMKEQDIDRAFYQRIPNFTENADIVTLFGSFNDLSAGDMGTALDTGTTTVGGCMNETINALTLKYPDALIGIIAPTPWWESFDYTTYPQYRQYVELLKEVAKRYSIPFLNLFEGSNLRPWDATFKANYFKNGDGTHPNTAGHRRIAGIMQSFIEKLIYSASAY